MTIGTGSQISCWLLTLRTNLTHGLEILRNLDIVQIKIVQCQKGHLTQVSDLWPSWPLV